MFLKNIDNFMLLRVSASESECDYFSTEHPIEESGAARKAELIFHATLRTMVMTRLSASEAEDNGVMQQFIVRTAEYHIFRRRTDGTRQERRF